MLSEEYMLIYRKSRTSTGSFLCFENFKLIFILTPHHDIFLALGKFLWCIIDSTRCTDKQEKL